MVDNESLLKQISFFAKLPMNTIRILAYLSMQKTFQAGDYLFYQNDDDGQGILIICGKARLEYTRNGSVNKTAPRFFRDVTDGEFVGGLALLGKMRRLFSMKALCPLDCLILERDRFAAAMAQFPDLMPVVLQAVIETIRRREERYLVTHQDASDQYIESLDVSLL